MKKKNDAPTIAVLIPMHNASKTIEYTIASLHNQTVKPDQIVIVDDCSDDISLMKAKELCPEAIFVKLNENVGAYHATFEGLDRVTCDYVVRCDSDDELTPRFIETAKYWLSLHSYDIVCMPQLRVDHNKEDLSVFSANLEPPCEYLDVPHCLDAFFSSQIPWYITGKVIRTSIFKSIRLSNIPKKIMLDDVFMTMIIYAVSHSYVRPDTSEGYIYHFGIGYFGTTKYSVTLKWWKELLETRLLQYKTNMMVLQQLGLDEYIERMADACEPLDLFETVPLLPCQDVADAMKIARNVLKFKYRGI